MLAAALASPALADVTTARTLAPGGTISTGSEATKANPVQMQVTVPAGGAITIVQDDSPARSTNIRGVDFYGPSFSVTPPRSSCTPSAYCGPYVDQKLTVVFLIDASAAPTAEPGQYREQDILRSFTSFDGQAPSSGETPSGPPELERTAEALPGGDYKITSTVRTGSFVDNGKVAHAGTWSLARQKFTGQVFFPRSKQGFYTLDALRRPFKLRAVCSWVCTISYEMSVTKKVAKKLKLKSTTLLEIPALKSEPKSFSLPAKVRKAIRGYSRVPIILTSVAKPVDPFPDRDRDRGSITFTDPEDDLG